MTKITIEIISMHIACYYYVYVDADVADEMLRQYEDAARYDAARTHGLPPDEVEAIVVDVRQVSEPAAE